MQDTEAKKAQRTFCGPHFKPCPLFNGQHWVEISKWTLIWIKGYPCLLFADRATAN